MRERILKRQRKISVFEDRTTTNSSTNDTNSSLLDPIIEQATLTKDTSTTCDCAAVYIDCRRRSSGFTVTSSNAAKNSPKRMRSNTALVITAATVASTQRKTQRSISVEIRPFGLTAATNNNNATTNQEGVFVTSLLTATTVCSCVCSS